MLPVNSALSVLQKLEDPFLAGSGLTIYVKRDDLIHPQISGNKWRKLKYNLVKAREEGYDTLLTFGGAFSNHILATAAAGREYNFKTIGIIRGEKHAELNDTLENSVALGMQLFYTDRDSYRRKDTPAFIEKLKAAHGSFYLIPEGGSNALAVKGCSEIPVEIEIPYDYICCACGTGATLAGLILGSQPLKKAFGFSSLKGGGFLSDDVQNFLDELSPGTQVEWEIIQDYHFGGYAKTTEELFRFADGFTERTNIPLDYVYNAKMFSGIYDMIAKGSFKPGETIVAIHTGGIQGNSGMKHRH